MTKRATRRNLIGCTAAMSGLVLAGCLTRVAEVAPKSGGDTTTNGNGTGSNGEDIGHSTIETVGANCGGPEDDESAVHRDGPVLVVTGVIPAPNPCHRAILDEVLVDDDSLSIVIDVEDATAPDEDCIQCHGALDYEALIDLTDGDTIATVDVTHATGDSHDLVVGTNGGIDPEIVDASIETVSTGCHSGEDETVQAVADDALVVTGRLTAPNPCHKAVLDVVAVEDTQLSLVVDVRSTLESGEVCIECSGVLEYEAVIELTDADHIDRLHVDHTTGSEHGIGWSRADETTEGPG